MKIVVFGATSPTGHHVVDQALADGHEVTAFVRSPEKLAVEDDKLHVFKGDALNPGQVEEALAGQDAVISLIGSAKGSPKGGLTQHGAHHRSDEAARRGSRGGGVGGRDSLPGRSARIRR